MKRFNCPLTILSPLLSGSSRWEVRFYPNVYIEIGLSSCSRNPLAYIFERGTERLKIRIRGAIRRNRRKMKALRNSIFQTESNIAPAKVLREILPLSYTYVRARILQNRASRWWINEKAFEARCWIRYNQPWQLSRRWTKRAPEAGVYTPICTGWNMCGISRRKCGVSRSVNIMSITDNNRRIIPTGRSGEVRASERENGTVHARTGELRKYWISHSAPLSSQRWDPGLSV